MLFFRYKKADEIYRLGIARKAEAIAHLKNRYSEFQKRMLTMRPQSSSPEEASRSSQTSSLTPVLGQRKVLGETSRSKAAPPLTTEQSKQPNARMQIFIDPTGEASMEAERSTWPELGTRVSRTKENRPEVFKMADGPLKSRAPNNTPGGVFNTAPRATFVPFRDVDVSACLPSSGPPSD